jgi:hypothetical protein
MRANSTAKGPITERARMKETNNTHKVEKKSNLQHLSNDNIIIIIIIIT